MRLCANENLPAECILRLRENGHDVLWIRESCPGKADADGLSLARAEERLLVTFDKDFGELVFRAGANASHGIILFRIAQPSAAVVADKIVAALSSRDDWTGQFSVVEDLAVRMRPLPAN